jgi:L-seryl-tRNA(Ser) seleniumtransferase
MGWVTILGGSTMPPEVIQAMNEAVDWSVNLNELNQAAGNLIARLSGAEAGLATSGAAGGCLLQAAACITGVDPAKIARLPDTTGLRNEIIIQARQGTGYLQCYRTAGAEMVQIGTARGVAPRELDAAINERTAAVAYVIGPQYGRAEGLSEVIDLAHAHGVPVILDAAAMLPPQENLQRYITMGADMVTFSGGKGVLGPQSTGILCGRKDLIEAATLNNSPNSGVGRAMKVCKEEIVGLMTALELFVERDYDAVFTEWRSRSREIVESLDGVEGVSCVVEYDGGATRLAPQAVVYFDSDWAGPAAQDIVARMKDGDPAIYIGSGGYRGELWVDPVNLRDDDVPLVAGRLREALTTQ